MDLTHQFTVPATRDETWTAFTNLDRVAPCFPGATITSIDGDDFAGSVKVKLGPIALVYTGTGRYLERDRGRNRMVIEAQGRDRRGNGTAIATLAATFVANGDRTDVEVRTDLSITGKPAQFGRGVISDVSDKLLDQFASCVSSRFAAGLGEPEPDAEPTLDLTAAPGHGAGPEPVAQLSSPPQSSVRPVPASYGYTPPTDASRSDFNVLATVGPVLLKRYWPVLAGGAAALFVISAVIKGARR